MARTRIPPTDPPPQGPHGSMDCEHCPRAKDCLRLSPQEIRVVTRVVRGMEDKEIAEEMRIKLTTVRMYFERACAKLGVSRRVQLAVHICTACQIRRPDRGSPPK